MALVQTILMLGYPAVVYFALEVFEPRWVALLTLALLAARMGLVSRERLTGWASAAAAPSLAMAGVLTVSAVWNDPLGLRLTPALVSFALLVAFAGSLAGESVVERFARAQVGWLDADEVSYCRRVTVMWCAFMLANGSIALWLSVHGTTSAWALYTGGVAHALVGLLFLSEFIYRKWRFRRCQGAPTDVVFRWLFPPRA